MLTCKWFYVILYGNNLTYSHLDPDVTSGERSSPDVKVGT